MLLEKMMILHLFHAYLGISMKSMTENSLRKKLLRIAEYLISDISKIVEDL